MENKGWIGVDFDGTLATYSSKQFPALGEPVPGMVERVKRWLEEGFEVRIVTARVDDRIDRPHYPVARVMEDLRQRDAISRWCVEHIGQALRVTNCKDFDMYRLYDDRARQVEPNTGLVVGEEDL